MIRVSLWLCSNGNGVTRSVFFFIKEIKRTLLLFKEKRWPYNKYDRTFFVTKLSFSIFYVIHFRLYCCHHCCFEPLQALNHLAVPQKSFRVDVLFFICLKELCGPLRWWKSYFHFCCMSKLVESSINSHQCIIKLWYGVCDYNGDRCCLLYTFALYVETNC